MARNQLENGFRFSISWIFNPLFSDNKTLHFTAIFIAFHHGKQGRIIFHKLPVGS